MLIKFQSKDSAAFSMLADDARPLLRGMGQGENLEGAVSGANLRDALARLESALRILLQAPQDCLCDRWGHLCPGLHE